jgi:hypothetical protein
VAIERIALRRRILIVPVLLSATFAAGCKSPRDLTGYTEEEASAPRPAAGIQVAAPNAAPQLISGWWDVEDHAWRWTARRFAVVLRAPIGSARRGATLRFRFTLPDVIFSHFKEVTLSVSLQGQSLLPETYHQPGAVLYSREIPVGLVSTPSVRLDFELDHSFSPGNGDSRDLGLIARSLGLESR